jgi:hypothetical protein
VVARFPLHDLEALIGWPTARELAEAVGVTVEAVEGWKNRGLSWRQADDLACRFNYPPAFVWGADDWCEAYVPPDHPRAARPPRKRPGPYDGVGSASELAERTSRLLAA